jgi:hypothetical protein
METKICIKCNIEQSIDEFVVYNISKNARINECKKCKSIYQQEYIQKNSEKLKKQKKEYREKNKEKVFFLKQKYYLNNKEKINRYKRDWENNKRKNDVLFKLKQLIRHRIYVFLKTKNITKNNKTFNIVGCEPSVLKEHLEKKFVLGMSWSNYGEWHIDHIIPLSSGKSEDEIYKLCHYTNLQPLWGEDNMKKGNKISPI